MTDYFAPERFMCSDCGHDVKQMGERFMVYGDVWDQIATGGSLVHMVCVACAESRLGRRLGPSDFPYCGLNWSANYWRSLRLRSRMMHRAVVS